MTAPLCVSFVVLLWSCRVLCCSCCVFVCVTCCCEQHRPRTTRRAPHIYPDIWGDGFQYHWSQLTFSDEWYCPQSCGPENVGSTPGLSHSHRRVLTPVSLLIGARLTWLLLLRVSPRLIRSYGLTEVDPILHILIERKIHGLHAYTHISAWYIETDMNASCPTGVRLILLLLRLSFPRRPRRINHFLRYRCILHTRRYTYYILTLAAATELRSRAEADR